MILRRGRFRPILTVVVVLLVALPLLAVGAGFMLLRSDGLKSRIAAVVLQATGRALTIDGGISLVPGLPTTLVARDVRLGNIPGGSRPDMARVRRIEVAVEVGPLLSGHISLARLTLIDPDILLEADAAGLPNWRLEPQSRPAAAPGAPGGGGGTAGGGIAGRDGIDIAALHISDGVITLRNGQTGETRTADIRRLSLAADRPDSPITVTAETRLGSQLVTWTGQTGSWARLRDESADARPWEMRLAAQAGTANQTASLTVAGGVRQPLLARGYDIRLTASMPDLSAFSSPGMALPALEGLTAEARVTDGPQGDPTVADMRIHADLSRLDGVLPGLQLTRADLTAPGPDDPVRIDALGLLGDTTLHATGTAGTVASMARRGALPIALNLEGGGGSASLNGTLGAISSHATIGQTAAELAAVDLTFAGEAPNLQALSGLAGQNLPELRPVRLRFHLTDLGHGVRAGFALADVAVVLGSSEFAGYGSAQLAERRAFVATVDAKRLDLDALSQAFRRSPPDRSPEAAAPMAAPGKGPHRLIPDIGLNLAGLRGADADASLKVGEVDAGGADYHNVVAHLLLKDGRLTLDPVHADTPGGPADGSATIDAHAAVPAFSAMVHAPGLNMAALHVPGAATGMLAVNADLHGVGADLRAIAAGLDGHVGLALADGEIGNQALADLAAPLLHAAVRGADTGPGGLIGGGSGETRLRCLALRLQATRGVASIGTLVLDTSRLLVEGAGTVNLGDETLALRVRPMFRIAGPGLVVPVRIGGTLAEPKVVPDAAGTASALAGFAASFTGTAAIVAAEDPCGPALLAARDGGPGPMPAPLAPQTRAPTAGLLPGVAGKPSKPADLLRGFLRR